MGFKNFFKHLLGDDWGVHPADHKRPAADVPLRVLPTGLLPPVRSGFLSFSPPR